MGRKKLVGILIVLCIVFIMVLPAIAGNGEEEKVDFGIISLLPPLLAIILAFVTKQVLLSLFIGVFAGAMMLNDWNPFYGFLRTLDEFIVGSLADGWNAAIIIFTLCIGGMVGVISKMGGTKAIAEALAKKAKSPRSSQLVTWLLGVIVFFDDYANTLIVGPTMRPLTDKMKISREKLAYIVDSTAAPVAGLALISTWIGTELGLLNKAFTNLGIEVNAYEIFIKTIPYRLYSIFAIIMVIVIALWQRDYGPMYKAEKRARLTGKVIADGAKPMAGKEMTEIKLKPEIKLRKANALVPILVLIIAGFVGLWYNGYTALASDNVNPFTWEGIRDCFGVADASVALIWAAILASLVAIIMAISQKIMKLSEAFDAWIDGSKSLLITCMILVLAWSLGTVTDQVGAADYLVAVVSDALPGAILPIIVFLISCLVAFATGTSWGTMAIVMPLAAPLAASYVSSDPTSAPLMLATLGSVLTGSIFGDHCSPISDTTIMSSMASASDHIDHVKTQIPYALTGAGLALVGYLIIGLLSKVTPWITLPVVLAMGIVGILLIVRFIGKSVKEKDLRALESEEA